jgi:predicted ester cyclase
VRRLVGLYRAAFPDLHFEHEEVISLGDRVAHRWTFSGTHRGEIICIEPTGRSVMVQGDRGEPDRGWQDRRALGHL